MSLNSILLNGDRMLPRLIVPLSTFVVVFLFLGLSAIAQPATPPPPPLSCSTPSAWCPPECRLIQYCNRWYWDGEQYVCTGYGQYCDCPYRTNYGCPNKLYCTPCNCGQTRCKWVDLCDCDWQGRNCRTYYTTERCYQPQPRQQISPRRCWRRWRR